MFDTSLLREDNCIYLIMQDDFRKNVHKFKSLLTLVALSRRLPWTRPRREVSIDTDGRLLLEVDTPENVRYDELTKVYLLWGMLYTQLFPHLTLYVLSHLRKMQYLMSLGATVGQIDDWDWGLRREYLRETGKAWRICDPMIQSVRDSQRIQDDLELQAD